MDSCQYWIVGAMFGGNDDYLEEFKLRGYWYCWDKNLEHHAPSGTRGNTVENQQERFGRIRKGDRIAVKRVLSIPEQRMEVRAIGIVKDIDIREWRVYVQWLPVFETVGTMREVNLRGLTASIHGPYSFEEPWIKEVFCI
jgi:hypothetical protein